MPHSCIVSICGPSGSGRSTLAKVLVESLGHEASVRIPADYYLVPAPSRAAFLERPLQYDWEPLEHAARALPGNTVITPDFDFETFRRIALVGGRTFIARPVAIIDALYPAPFADVKVLLTAPDAVRRERVRRRDKVWGTQVAERWEHLNLSHAQLEAMPETYHLVLSGDHAAVENARRIVALVLPICVRERRDLNESR